MGKHTSPAVKWLLALGVGGGLLLLVCCCGIGGFIAWLVGPGRQVPTVSIVTERSALILHSTLNPNDSGVQDLLGYIGELVQQTQQQPPEDMPIWLRRMVKQSQEQNVRSFQMGVNMILPREFTLAVELPSQPKGEPHFTVSANPRWFSNFFRFVMGKGGKVYKSANYTVDREDGSVFVLGFYGGTFLASDDEATFRQTIDRIEQTMQQGKTPTFDLKHLKGEFDLVAIIKPREKGWDFGELPSDRAEIGMDIMSADEWKGDSVWLCRSEEEAKLLSLALMVLRKELAQSAEQNGLSLSFQGQQEGNRYRLRFRLTGIKAWLKREFQKREPSKP